MLPWAFSEEAAAEKYMAQLQHNMWVVAARTAVLSVVTGGGKMGRDRHSCRSALSAPHRNSRAEVLALCGERRAPSSLWCRAAEAADRGRNGQERGRPFCFGDHPTFDENPG